MDEENNKNDGVKSVSNSNFNEYILAAAKSLCEIFTPIQSTSGFLIKLFKNDKDFYCLMTNGQIILKDMIEKKAKIKFYYDRGAKSKEIYLNSKERFILELSDINLNVIIIEILKSDSIDKKYFLLPFIDYSYNIEHLLNKDIIAIKTHESELNHNTGKIIKIIDNKFIHNINIKEDLSYSPIFLKDSMKVIGFDKSEKIDNSKINGYFIGPIYNFLNNLNKDKMVLSNNFYYIGESRNGIPNGKGIKYNQNGKIVYEGDFVNGKYEGKGKIYFEDGKYYIGQFKNDLPNGKGTKYFENGDIKYQGEVLNGKAEGKGKCVFDDREYCIGQWKNDLKHGEAIIYYENGSIKYDGDFINDSFNGYGKYIYRDNQYYIGQWKNDLKHGKGTIFYQNGKIKYKGNFINDQMEGNGKYIYKDDKYYIGNWKNNIKHGIGTFYDKEGSIIYSGEWVWGIFLEK